MVFLEEPHLAENTCSFLKIFCRFLQPANRTAPGNKDRSNKTRSVTAESCLLLFSVHRHYKSNFLSSLKCCRTKKNGKRKLTRNRLPAFPLDTRWGEGGINKNADYKTLKYILIIKIHFRCYPVLSDACAFPTTGAASVLQPPDVYRLVHRPCSN